MLKIPRQSFSVLPTQIIGMVALLFFSGMGLKGCISGKFKHAEGHHVMFTDSAEASVRIVKDDVEKYFEHVTTIDMAIQMKKEMAGQRDQVSKEQFVRFIRTQVSDWKAEEKKLIRQTLEEAFGIVKKLNPDCLPKISLIKIKTNHYGNHVYYTRGHHICIPENIFTDYDHEVQLRILIHEIFHVISKNNPEYRDSLYALIGFKKLPASPEVPEALKKKLLTNPDGVSRAHVIRLGEESNGEKPVLALPLITSKWSDFDASMPHFFDYLGFDLYPVEFKNGKYQVGADTMGNTKMPMELTTHFFMKIRDNTQYIIHPEEIMADNFMLAALAAYKNDFTRFSPKGKQLIEDIIHITKETNFTR